jgi:high-affinity K+ transport system ATPase subunit B
MKAINIRLVVENQAEAKAILDEIGSNLDSVLGGVVLKEDNVGHLISDEATLDTYVAEADSTMERIIGLLKGTERR